MDKLLETTYSMRNTDNDIQTTPPVIRNGIRGYSSSIRGFFPPYSYCNRNGYSFDDPYDHLSLPDEIHDELEDDVWLEKNMLPVMPPGRVIGNIPQYSHKVDLQKLDEEFPNIALDFYPFYYIGSTDANVLNCETIIPLCKRVRRYVKLTSLCRPTQDRIDIVLEYNRAGRRFGQCRLMAWFLCGTGMKFKPEWKEWRQIKLYTSPQWRVHCKHEENMIKWRIAGLKMGRILQNGKKLEILQMEISFKEYVAAKQHFEDLQQNCQKKRPNSVVCRDNKQK